MCTYKLRVRVAICFVFLLCSVFVTNITVFSQDQQKLPTTAEIVRDSTLIIASAIEKYSNEHNVGYPKRINALLIDSYLRNFPNNPYTLKMKIVYFNSNSPGDITYITVRDRKTDLGYGYILPNKGSKKENNPSLTISYNGKRLYIKRCHRSGSLISRINESGTKYALDKSMVLNENGQILNLTPKQFEILFDS